HRISNTRVRRVLNQVSQRARLVVLVVQRLERTDRVPAAITHRDEITRLGGTPPLQGRQNDEEHQEDTDQESNRHHNLPIYRAAAVVPRSSASRGRPQGLYGFGA